MTAKKAKKLVVFEITNKEGQKWNYVSRRFEVEPQLKITNMDIAELELAIAQRVSPEASVSIIEKGS